MVKIQNADLQGAIFALQALAAERLPMPTVLKVITLHKEVAVKHDIVEQARLNLIEKYAERNDRGEKIADTPINGQPATKIKPAERPEFNAAFKELLEMDSEVHAEILKPSDFPDIEEKSPTGGVVKRPREIAPEILIALGPLFVR